MRPPLIRSRWTQSGFNGSELMCDIRIHAHVKNSVREIVDGITSMRGGRPRRSGQSTQEIRGNRRVTITTELKNRHRSTEALVCLLRCRFCSWIAESIAKRATTMSTDSKRIRYLKPRASAFGSIEDMRARRTTVRLVVRRLQDTRSRGSTVVAADFVTYSSVIDFSGWSESLGL